MNNILEECEPHVIYWHRMGTNEVLDRTKVPRPLPRGLGVEAEGHWHVMAATYTCTPTWRVPLTTMGVRSTRMRLVHDVPNECAYNASSSWQYWRICIVYDPLSLWGRPRLFKIPSPWTFRNFQTGSSTDNSQLNLELLKISSKMYEKLSVLLMFIRFSTDIWTRRVKTT